MPNKNRFNDIFATMVMPSKPSFELLYLSIGHPPGFRKCTSWDSIVRTEYWDIVHAYNTSIPGWLVLVLRRHAGAVSEMTETEAGELGILIRSVSIALQQITGCLKTYVVQFAEQAEHPHVHFHIIPRMPNQPDEYTGTGIFNLLGVPDTKRMSEAAMNEIATRLRHLLDPG